MDNNLLATLTAGAVITLTACLYLNDRIDKLEERVELVEVILKNTHLYPKPDINRDMFPYQEKTK